MPADRVRPAPARPQRRLWIAATAIRWRIPLVAHDAIFDGCTGLELRTELDTRLADRADAKRMPSRTHVCSLSPCGRLDAGAVRSGSTTYKRRV
jgi:hypothetical protein